MSTFQMPFSSSPSGPSTPGPKSLRGIRSDFGDSLPSNPSTTPAGPPPPSSVASFTPAGPPPSAIFGSSQLSALNSSPYPFQDSLSKYSKSPNDSRSNKDMKNANGASTSIPRTYQNGVPKNVQDVTSDASTLNYDTFGFHDPKQQRAADSALLDDIRSVHGEDDIDLGISRSRIGLNGNTIGFNGSIASKNRSLYSTGLGSSFGASSPRGVKRSRGGALITGRSLEPLVDVLLPRPDSGLTSIAKDMARQIGGPVLSETPDLITDTEDVVDSLYHSGSDGRIDRPSGSGFTISQASAALCQI